MNRRRVFTLAAALIAVIVPSGAQQQAGAQQATTPAPSQKVPVGGYFRNNPVLYEFKYLDDESARAVVHLLQFMFRLTATYEPKLHAVVISPIVGGDTEKATDFLKHYDVPSPPEPQIRFTAYLIRAADAAPANAQIDSPIPHDLQDAVTEMKKSFVYTHYTLLDTVSSVSHGGASASDMLPAQAPYALGYDIEYGNVSVSPDRKSVNVKPFSFRLRNGGKDNVMASFGSDITIREGQKLVLGKVRMPREIVQKPGSEPTAGGRPDLFVVLTVKVE